MADKQVQIRKGTTAANDGFTGALGELSFDTQQNRLRLHNGSTPGGFPHALSFEVAARVLKAGDTMTGDLDIGSAVHLDATVVGGISTFGPAIFLYHDSGQLEINELFASGVDILTGTILLSPDGSAQFAGGQITISNTGAVNVNLNTALNTYGSVAFGASGVFTISTTGLIGFPDGVRQTFNPNGTNAGLNVGSLSGDPSAPSNGDLWYDSTGNLLRARINGATVSLGAGGTPGGADTQIQFNDAGVFGGDAGFLYNKTTDLITSLKTAIGATPADSLQLTNTTAAAVGAQQYSPALRFTGQGWKTVATAASQPVDWRVYNQPVQGATTPTSNLVFDVSINGGAFATVLTLLSSNLIATNGTFQSTSVTLGATGTLSWAARGSIKSSADGIIELFNAAQNNFTRLNFGGTTSSFGAIARNGAGISIVLADGSANAALTALSVTTSQTAFMHNTSAALADGAGASAGTLANAPAVGNPTKWIPINDNGTTRYIPAW